jgi:peroxiredoxin
MLLLIGILLITGTVGYVVTNRPQGTGIGPSPSTGEGGLAPNFTLRALDGTEVSLASYRDKAVAVVNFWATWCPPCREEIPDLVGFHDDFKDKGVVVLAVNLREPEDHVRDFAKDAQMDFPIVCDFSGDVANAYEVEAIPTTVIVDRSGTIRSRIVGMTSRAELEEIVKPLL